VNYSLFSDIFNNFMNSHEKTAIFKIRIERHGIRTIRLVKYDCSEYDGGGIYEDENEKDVPDQIIAPSYFQAKLLLFYSDIIEQLV